MEAKYYLEFFPKNRLYIDDPTIGVIDHLAEATAKDAERKTPNKERDQKYRMNVHGYHTSSIAKSLTFLRA